MNELKRRSNVDFHLVKEFSKRMGKQILYKRFEANAARIPDKLAVLCEDYRLSYKELNKKANQLAHLLINSGVGLNTPVGLYLNHNHDIPIAVLAVLKARGYYVPLSTSFPIHKIEEIVDDCSCRVVLTNTTFPEQEGVLMLNIADEEIYNKFSDHNPDLEGESDDIVYVLYTSGTTGKPKGVTITNQNLTYYVDWYLANLFDSVDGHLPLMSSLSFAAAVKQLYVPLVKGALLQIIPPRVAQNSSLLFEWYRENPSYGMYIVPTLWQEHLEYAKNNRINTLPAFIHFSGEPLKQKLVNETFDYVNNIKLWNLYGPTETVANISYSKVERGNSVNIGRILEGSEAILVDENLNPAKKNEPGELCVSGPGVTPGYLNREELNQKQFIVINGKRYYRTGDFASYLDDGNLKHLGRIDRQVKINGIRIELGEIEHALVSLKDVKEAIVLINRKEDYNHRLMAYLLTDYPLSYAEYINELKTKLSDYAMPAVINTVKSFPKLPNGKIDVLKLAKSTERKQPANIETYQDNEKQKLKTIVSELLDVVEIPDNQNILYAGANSITVIKLVNRIQANFGAKLFISDVYEQPTINAIYELILIRTADQNQPAEKSAAFSPKENKSPLAINQKTMWLVDKTKDVKHAYNIVFAIDFQDQHFSLEKLQKAVHQVTLQNDVLRSVIIPDGNSNNPVRILLNDHRPEISYHQIADSEQKEAIVQKFNTNLLKEEKTPPVRYLFFSEKEEYYSLVVIIHHIIFDGYSINLFSQQLLDAYQKESNEKPEQAANYGQFAWQQNQMVETDAYHESIDYWTTKIKSDSYTLNLPLDHPRPQFQEFSGDTVSHRIGSSLKNKILNFCKKQDVSFFNLLLNAYAILLHKYSNQKDILISFPYANRNNLEYENVLGYFTNVILFRSLLNEEDTFLELLKKGKQHILEDSKHWECPLEAYYPQLNVEVNPSMNSLYQVMFALHEKLISVDQKGIKATVEEYATHSSKLDLYLEAQDEEDNLLIKFSYNTSIFSRDRIERFTGDYLKILSAIIADPGNRISKFSLVTSEEISLMQQWNKTAVDYQRKLSVYDLFAEAVSRYPDNIALRHDNIAFTYRELEEKIDTFATVLVQRGLKKQQFVGISIKPSPEMLIAIMAILRIGAAYVPLDPDYPDSRISYIIASSTMQAIITDEPEREFSDGIHTIYTTTVTDKSEPLPEVEYASSDIMYVMYTSGSTGRSKGVVVPHKGVANYLLWMQTEFEMNQHEVFLYQASINFDISVLELLLPLISGATLVITPKDEITSSDLIQAVIERNKITMLQFVPSALWAFVTTCKTFYQSTLKKVFVGGERLPAELRDTFFKTVDAQLINLYGPTEASIYCTFHNCSKEDHSNVTIGKPIHNAKIYVLDENLNQLPIGSKGEIFIGGDILANGYMKNEQETNARFINHEELGERLFRTGDIGSFRNDGNIDFWGRTDKQVKVRGYRIELAEIENVISRMEAIEKVSVLVYKHSETDKRIVAFYTLFDSNGILKPQEIRSFLRKHLPKYMIPSDFVQMKSFPILPNGKTNNAGLLEQYSSKRNENIDQNDLPMSEIEQKIHLIWERVLHSRDFGSDDNFFEVGGHSLLILKVQEQIKQVLNKDIPLMDFYRNTSIRSIAKSFMENEENRETIKAIRDRIKKVHRMRTNRKLR